MLSTRETIRLHRWTMWRMSVNEGIISYLHHEGSLRLLSPEYMEQLQLPPSQDSSSLGSSDEVPPFPRGVSLRERYGSSHGLSDDAYFIFGLPRVSVRNHMPEVTTPAGRSGQGEAIKQERELLRHGDIYPSCPLPSDLGPIPDDRSVASRNDEEIQRINGFREWKEWSPIPQLTPQSGQGKYDRTTTTNNSSSSTNYYNPREAIPANYSGYPGIHQSYLPDNPSSAKTAVQSPTSWEKVDCAPLTFSTPPGAVYATPVQVHAPSRARSSPSWTYPPFSEDRQRSYVHTLEEKVSGKTNKPAYTSQVRDEKLTHKVPRYDWDETLTSRREILSHTQPVQLYGR